MTWDRTTVSAYGVSAFLHLILVLFIPGIGEQVLDFDPKWVEVVLIPEINDLPEILPSDSSSRNQDGHGPDSPVDATLPAHGDSPIFPSPPIWLPAKLADIDAEPPVQMDTMPGNISLQISGDGVGIPGDLTHRIESVFDRPETISIMMQVS